MHLVFEFFEKVVGVFCCPRTLVLSIFDGWQFFGANLVKLEQNNIDTIWLKMMAIDILALFAENLVLSKMDGHFKGSVFSYRREIWCCP